MFTPDFIFNAITDITIDFLKEHEIRALILDVDETLSAHGSQVPFPGVREWIEQIKEHNIKLMISSNNVKARVAPFAESLNLPFISMSLKPFPIGLTKIKKEFGLPSKEIAIVGDQIFTDILGGSVKGFKKIFVLSSSENAGLLLKFKRTLERPFLWGYYKKKGANK